MIDDKRQSGEDRRNHMEHIEPPRGRVTDPAMQSLADALRVSFRVLSGLMVLFVVLFLATGIGSVSPQERGLVKVFGRITGVAEEGFVYNWPFPIGEIEKVNIQERQIRIEDFWLFELPGDKLKDLASRGRTNTGLRPGWDGYLLTGDRSLVHIKFVCRYQVQDPVAVKTRIVDLEPVLRDVLCRAALQAGGMRTADAIQVDPTGFLRDVEATAQAELDTLLGVAPGGPHAIRINSVLSENKTWPLAAFTAYERAQQARTEKTTKINKARSEARDLTKVVGGENLVELVGEPWSRDLESEAQRTRKGKYEEKYEGKDYNLIGHLSYLESQQDKASAEVRLEIEKQIRTTKRKIDTILTRATATGEVQGMIAAAYSKKTEIIQRAEKRAQEFEKRHAEYVKAPELFLENEWANVLDDIFNAPTNTKHYLRPGKKGDVLIINEDPRVTKEIRDYLRKEKNEKKK